MYISQNQNHKKLFGDQWGVGPTEGGRGETDKDWFRETFLLRSFLSPTWACYSLGSSCFRTEKQQGQLFPYNNWNRTTSLKMARLSSL